MQQALVQTLNKLQTKLGDNPKLWHWGQVHIAISAHKPFGRVPVLSKLFNVETPIGGDGYTVNVGRYDLTGPQPFAAVHAPSLRTIYDLSDLSKSQFIYQTGQNGNLLSNRYSDMSSDWATGGYRLFGSSGDTAQHTLTLQP